MDENDTHLHIIFSVNYWLILFYYREEIDVWAWLNGSFNWDNALDAHASHDFYHDRIILQLFTFSGLRQIESMNMEISKTISQKKEIILHQISRKHINRKGLLFYLLMPSEFASNG